MRVISGGQTGADRAALDAALESGIPCGGWCPLGRVAEDGVIDFRYPLRETASEEVEQRTRWNVRDSDGTLILDCGTELVGGTALTRDLARELRKPWLVVDPSAAADVSTVADWLRSNRIRTVNIAGPRESTQPGTYAKALAFLRTLFEALHDS